MNKIFDALEICLQELENGADLESVLARYPGYADELRPILKTAIMAGNASVPPPSADVVRRQRARVLQSAAEMREAAAQIRRRPIPLIRRLLISVSVAALLLLISGNDLLNASASALPGERLYPVKRGWENARLMFVLDPAARSALETQFYYERLSEVTNLLAHGRVAPIEFAGIYLEVDSQIYVSGIRIMVFDATILPSEPIRNGTAVLVRGSTTAVGTVRAVSIQLLTDPSIVPVGDPVVIPSTPTLQVKSSPTPQPTAENENANENPVNTQVPNTNSNTNNNSNDDHGGNQGKDNSNDDDDDDNDDDNENDD